MITLRIYYLSNPIYHIAVLAIVIMLCTTSLLVLTYLITGSLCLLTTFIQFCLSLPPASSNHKSFSEFL